jgi:hypothetical protein
MNENMLLNTVYDMVNSNGAPNEILKAIIAGDGHGHDYVNQLSSGPGLKPESLDPMLKSLEYKMKDIVLWNMIPKQPIFNTVHDYNQLVKYGQDLGIFMGEGDRPENTDSQYRRKSILTKYMGVGGKVTLQAQMVKNADGKDPYTREVENKLILLMKLMNVKLVEGESAKDSYSFDGIFKQHLMGVNEIYGDPTSKTPEQLLDTYFQDVSVIDARGKALTEDNIQDATNAVSTTRFGDVDSLITHPEVLKDFARRFHESKRIIPGMAGGVVGATMGQSINGFQTQLGYNMDLKSDKFFDRRDAIKYNVAANSAKAPATPTLTSCVAATDTKNKFGSAFAGTYFYVVVAGNRYGQSAPLAMNTTGLAVAATESVDLTFADGGGNYPATYYTVYRTKAGVADRTTAEYYPLFSVSVAEKAAGYDGGTATKVRDRNRFIAGTRSALVMAPSTEIWEYLQLAATMKIEFALVTLAKEFAVVNFGTPVIYQPGKICRIVNLGSDISV